MCTKVTTFLLLLVLALASVSTCMQEPEVVQRAWFGLRNAMHSAQALWVPYRSNHGSRSCVMALGDCVKLYADAESRLRRLVSNETGFSRDDAITWLSAGLASHRSCLDGLEEKGLVFEAQTAQNLTMVLGEALAFYGRKGGSRGHSKGAHRRQKSNQNVGFLASGNAATSMADIVVAQDGSGNYKTINEAVAALEKMDRISRPGERLIVYVKKGVYNEKVEIGRSMKKLTFVGDGVDKTVITGNLNVQDGATTLSSATFGVSGDGFWARDITFENTAGPQKHQAVALRVSSDLSIFYNCSFKGYQDTLLVHSLRQFYRDCQIYGTIDFIFGDATSLFQNCEILVRKPMDHQANMITAQGRDNPNENSGISIVNSRVSPAPDFYAFKGQFKSYLGRPWKKYSRTVFLKTELDGLVDPRGWMEWSGDFALSTLYYGEYMNSGFGASTAGRVRWPGFHVINDSGEAARFSVRNFIQGEEWIPVTGVPFWPNV